MDGSATNNRVALGFSKKELTGGRSKLELYTLATRAGSLRAAGLIGSLRADIRDVRGLPERFSAWPEWLWSQWCDDAESAEFTESDVLAMRGDFLDGARNQLELDGFDCR